MVGLIECFIAFTSQNYSYAIARENIIELFFEKYVFTCNAPTR